MFQLNTSIYKTMVHSNSILLSLHADSLNIQNATRLALRNEKLIKQME